VRNVEEKLVSGRDGSLIIDRGTYQNIPIMLIGHAECKRTELIDYFGTTGELKFETSPDRFWKYRVTAIDIKEVLDAIYRGDFDIDERSVIKIESENEVIETSPYALNDISILKRDNASMITIHTNIDDEYLVTYQADGLIISTPTGSTAYSLSNGGPIIVPRGDILCLTPVAPHSLNIRPIVFNNNVIVRLKVESRSHNYLVAIDGRSVKLKEGTILTIKKASFVTRIVKCRNYSYFSTLRTKLMWGADLRK